MRTGPAQVGLRPRVGAVGAVAVATCWGAAPAAAHSGLEASLPAQGVHLSAPPEQVRLTFASPVTAGPAHIVVVGPDGSTLAAGPAQVADRTVVQPVRQGSGSGSYSVAYRVVADDGHPIAGTLRFTSAGARSPATGSSAPGPSLAPAPGPVESSGPVAAEDREDAGIAAGGWLLGGLAALGAGSVLAARRTSGRQDVRP